mgnify:CR=1 FL=1
MSSNYHIHYIMLIYKKVRLKCECKCCEESSSSLSSSSLTSSSSSSSSLSLSSSSSSPASSTQRKRVSFAANNESHNHHQQRLRKKKNSSNRKIRLGRVINSLWMNIAYSVSCVVTATFVISLRIICFVGNPRKCLDL